MVTWRWVLIRPWPIRLFFLHLLCYAQVLSGLPIMLLICHLLCSIMHKHNIIIIERHTTTILMVCYTEASLMLY